MILENHIIGISLTLVDENIHSAQDYLDCLEEINQLYKNFYFNNAGPISFKNRKSENISKLIYYYKKIVELEQILKLKFEIEQHAVTVGDFKNMEILYRSLIEKKPWRIKEKLKNVKYDWPQTPNEIKDLLENKKEILPLVLRKRKHNIIQDKFFITYVVCIF